MSLPHTLKNFNVFAAGDNWVGLVEEVELPKLKKKIEDYRAAGMIAPAPIDLGFEKLEMNMTFGGLVKAALVQFAVCGNAAAQLRISGAYQRDDTCEVVAVDVVVRGLHTELDMGSLKGGDRNKIKVSSALTYYKLVVGGDTVIEIDTTKPYILPDSLSGAVKSALGL